MTLIDFMSWKLLCSKFGGDAPDADRGVGLVITIVVWQTVAVLLVDGAIIQRDPGLPADVIPVFGLINPLPRHRKLLA